MRQATLACVLLQGSTATVEVRASLRHNTRWAAAGHVASLRQLPLILPQRPAPAGPIPALAARLLLEHGGDWVAVERSSGTEVHLEQVRQGGAAGLRGRFVCVRKCVCARECMYVCLCGTYLCTHSLLFLEPLVLSWLQAEGCVRVCCPGGGVVAEVSRASGCLQRLSANGVEMLQGELGPCVFRCPASHLPTLS